MAEVTLINQQKKLPDQSSILSSISPTIPKFKAKSSMDNNTLGQVLTQTNDKDQNHLLTVRFKKKIQNMKLQTELFQLKKYIHTEKQLQKNKQILTQIQQQLNQHEELTRQYKREMISSRIKQMKKRSHSRREYLIKSNQQLQEIMHYRQVIKQQIDKKLHQEKQQYDRLYKETLEKRKQARKRIDFQSLREHEEKYLNNSSKFKANKKQHNLVSEPNQRYAHHDIDPFYIQTEIEKRKRLAQMIKKRKQYGNKMQKQKRNIRVKTQSLHLQRQRQSNQKFDKIMKLRQQLAKMKKPALQCRGDWQKGSANQIKKLKKTKDVSVSEKISRLNNLAEGYKLHFENGKQQALSLMSAATLAKAQLLLHYQKEKQSNTSNRSRTMNQ